MCVPDHEVRSVASINGGEYLTNLILSKSNIYYTKVLIQKVQLKYLIRYLEIMYQILIDNFQVNC